MNDRKMNVARMLGILPSLIACRPAGWPGRMDTVRSSRHSGKRRPIPDFTRGGKKDDSHDWKLGPTGARGWVYGWKGQTADARQILVTAVAGVAGRRHSDAPAT